MRETVRQYGEPPYRIAVIHGGPGAPGYMAPVARELNRITGIIEPLQTKDSLRGQIYELRGQLAARAHPPVILVGSSWGAALALFVAAEQRETIAKLILIGSAVFDAESSSSIDARRMRRLGEEGRRRYDRIGRELKLASGNERHRLMEEWGELLFDTDVYDPITRDLETMDVQPDIFEPVWADFAALRDKPGYLRDTFSTISAPVVVIHGDYDPHPIEGIRPFLEDCLHDVRFYLLPECGHYPWIEKHARRRFYDILFEEISHEITK